jgi:hypothetical protein
VSDPVGVGYYEVIRGNTLSGVSSEERVRTSLWLSSPALARARQLGAAYRRSQSDVLRVMLTVAARHEPEVIARLRGEDMPVEIGAPTAVPVHDSLASGQVGVTRRSATPSWHPFTAQSGSPLRCAVCGQRKAAH